MASAAILPLSQLPSLFPQKPNISKLPYNRSWLSNSKPRASRPPRMHCHKMYVPEPSPEAKAANNLHSFFTYVAVRIVCAQLESYNTEAYEELMEFLSRNSLNDGDQFCANLMRESSRHKGLGDFLCDLCGVHMAALRILEVRSAYCKNDFEWDNLQRLAFKMVDESNKRLMRDYVRAISHVEGDQGSEN